MNTFCRHVFRDGKCFWCGAPRPMPNGEWPTGTWFQRRLNYIRAKEIDIDLAAAEQARERGAMQ